MMARVWTADVSPASAAQAGEAPAVHIIRSAPVLVCAQPTESTEALMAIHEYKGDGFAVTFDPDICTPLRQRPARRVRQQAQAVDRSNPGDGRRDRSANKEMPLARARFVRD
jgi:hypothetical protein